jgi:hypothetical protein
MVPWLIFAVSNTGLFYVDREDTGICSYHVLVTFWACAQSCGVLLGKETEVNWEEHSSIQTPKSNTACDCIDCRSQEHFATWHPQLIHSTLMTLLITILPTPSASSPINRTSLRHTLTHLHLHPYPHQPRHRPFRPA